MWPVADKPAAWLHGFKYCNVLTVKEVGSYEHEQGWWGARTCSLALESSQFTQAVPDVLAVHWSAHTNAGRPVMRGDEPGGVGKSSLLEHR